MRGTRFIPYSDLPAAAFDIPGVRRSKSGDVLIPWHALHLVNALGYNGGYRTWIGKRVESPLAHVDDPVALHPFVSDETRKRATPAQREDLRRALVTSGGILDWPTGSGKTLLGLAFSTGFGLAQDGGPRALIVVPSTTTEQWRRQALRWLDPRVRVGIIVQGQPRVKKRARATWTVTEDACRALCKTPGALTLALSDRWAEEDLHPGEAALLRKAKAEKAVTQDYVVLDDLDQLVAGPFAEEEDARSAAGHWTPGDYDVLVVGWGILPQDAVREALLAWKPRVLVVDEAHRLGKQGSMWRKVESKTSANGAGDDATAGDTFERKAGAAANLHQISAQSAAAVLLMTATPQGDLPKNWHALLDVYDPYSFGNFSQFGVRYCLSPETGVLMADGSYSPIEHVKVGDYVMGWALDGPPGPGRRRFLRPTRVLECFAVPDAPRVRLTTPSGSVVCTPDHEWLYFYKTNRSANPYRRADAPERAVVQGKTYWYSRPIKRLLRLAYAPAAVASGDFTPEYREGYLRGLVEGDGTVRRKPPAPRGVRSTWADTYSVVVRCLDEEHMVRGHQFAADLALGPKPLKREKSGLLRLAIHTKRGYERLTRSIEDEASLDFWRGWLAGIYDAEGCGNVIAQYRKVNPETHARICSALVKFDFQYTADPEAVRILGGTLEVRRFFALVKPALSRKAPTLTDLARFSPAEEPVVGFERLPPGPVACIKTETGNFIAEGWGSHNCGGHRGEYGMVYDSLSNVDELRSRLSMFWYYRSKKETHKGLPEVRREFVTIDLRRAGRVDMRALNQELRDGDMGGSPTAIQVAVATEQKIPWAVDRLREHIRSGHRAFVWVALRANAKRLEAELTETFPEVPVYRADGTLSSVDRAKLVDTFIATPDGKPAIMVGTIAAFSEAIDGLQHVDVALVLTVPWTPQLLIQGPEGRHSRMGGTRNVLLIYTRLAGTIDDRIWSRMGDKLGMVAEVRNDDDARNLGSDISGDSPEQQAAALAAMAETLTEWQSAAGAWKDSELLDAGVGGINLDDLDGLG